LTSRASIMQIEGSADSFELFNLNYQNY